MNFKKKVCFSRISRLKVTDMFMTLTNSLLWYLLAHLSRRLTGELIGYPWNCRPSVGVRRPSVCSHFQTSAPLKPLGQSKPNFFMEPPWKGGTKVYINGPGHMTKMAATPIYGKNPSKIFFSRTGEPIFTKLSM